MTDTRMNMTANEESVRTRLNEILGQALGISPAEIDGSVPFMDLGATSLALVDAFRAIQQSFGVRPTVRRVFEEYDTVDRLADYVVRLMAEAPGREAAIDAAAEPEPASVPAVPLFPFQHHLWFLARYSEGAMLAHSHRVVWQLDGVLQPESLERALEQVRDRHESLRTRFDPGDVQQRITEGRGAVLEMHDFSAAGVEQQRVEAGAWLAAEARRPFDLRQPLWRAALLRLGSGRSLLVLSAHGLIADRSALQRLAGEVASIYTALESGAEPELGPPMGLAHYGTLLDEVASSPGYGGARAYWTDRFLDGIPELNLPLSGSRPPIKQYFGARLVVPLPADLVRSIYDWSAQRRTTPYGAVLAAFQVWLHRLTGQRDVILGVFGQGVPSLSSTTPLVSNTTNPLPFRMAVDGAAPFAAHGDAVRDELLAAFDHQHYPFAALIRDLNPERDQSRSAIFSVALDWEPARAAPGFAGVTASRVNSPVAYVPYDLLLTAVEVDGGLQLQCDYSTELFEAGTIRQWMRSFTALLGSALAADGPIHRLRLMTEDEERRVVDEWNRTDRDYPVDRCFHDLVVAQAARTPEATAVIADDTTLSYVELVEQADALAALLRARGVGPGSLVGLGAARSSRLLVGMLGILKAGGAYVPLDPSYPEERLRFMLQDTGAHLLLTEASQAATFAWHDGEVLLLDALPDPGDSPSGPTPAHDPRPDDLAYLLYTSGSTGRPKGVPITHRALVNLGTFLAEAMAFTADDVVLATTSLSFDIAVTELLFPLAVGARIVLVPRREATDAAALMARIQEHGATLMQATPSHWQGLLAAGWSGSPDLRILTIGEALKPHLAERLAQVGRELWNWYGPSETTICSTGGRVTAGGPVTIGRPVANTQVYILDPLLHPVPVGMAGELCIGGDGLSPGYWRRPEFTADRFIANPIPGGRSPRLYRTGDLARYRPDGSIEYLGRSDEQVKIHGVRIEPGEIEAVLQSHDAIQQAAVVARDEHDGLKSLVAYLVPRSGAELSPTELRTFLAGCLPEFMIPAAFVVLRSLPLTPAGKLDSRGLPEPSGADRMTSPATHVPPRTPVEESLCAIWRDLLKLDRVGVHDSFFDLGGHSLLLAPLMIRVRDVFQLRVGMRDVFDRPTVAELAGWIEELRAGQATSRESARPEQSGPAARARFDFLRSEARLDPALRPDGAAPPSDRFAHLLVTGATGFVGAYILHFLMEQTTATLHCLIRAEDPAAGLERIRRNVSSYGLWRASYEDRIVGVPGDLARPQMGLDDPTWDRLAETVDAILHSAALVNFVYPYQALKPINVDGVRGIIAFACHARVKPIHYVSTTAVWPMGAEGCFDEGTDLDHDRLLNLAYDETKWVAEKMLMQAAERGVPVAVYRPGEVSGDSRTGESDDTHLASAFVKGSLQAGVFPAIGRLDAAPVDYVARALVYLVTRPDSLGRVFHLCNPDAMNADEAYAWFRKRGYQFDVVPFDEWRRKILADPALEQNALYPFAPLLEEFGDHSMQLPDWRTERTLMALEGSGIRCAPLDDELVGTYVAHFLATGFLPGPEQLRGASTAATGA